MLNGLAGAHNQPVPRYVNNLGKDTSVTAVATGETHTCAMVRGGLHTGRCEMLGGFGSRPPGLGGDSWHSEDNYSYGRTGH